MLKAAVAFVPVAALLAYSVARFVRRRTVPLLWGEPTSAGHYLDLVSAGLGVALLALAAVLRIVRARSSL